MCTLVVLRRPGHHWPLLIAGNRDEMLARQSSPPERHWPDLDWIVGGKDEQGGGSWLAITEFGLVAAIMNRAGTLGPQAGKKSRGEIVLNALKHADAVSAARTVAGLRAQDYRGFNLVVADRNHAFWLRHQGDGDMEIFEIPPGLHMLTAGEMDDADDARIRLYRPRFKSARTPDPDRQDWRAWAALLHSSLHVEPSGPEAAMFQQRGDGFMTLASHLIAAPADEEKPPVFLYRDWTDEGGGFVNIPL